MSGGLTKSFIRLVGTVGLLCFTDFGDYLTSLPFVLNCRKFNAVLDNMIHVWIGLLTLSVVAEEPWALSPDLFLVALGSSFIDLDHFLAARSFSVDDAMHAGHRGIFHCTGLALLITPILYKYRPHWALLFLISVIPHHLRDAQRRGLYIVPFFPDIETPPINKHFVKIILPLFPWLLLYFNKKYFTNNVIPLKTLYNV